MDIFASHPEYLAATRFTAVVALFLGFASYAIVVIRAALHRGWNPTTADVLGIAIVLEMFGACLHQSFWMTAELLSARGHCSSDGAIEKYCVAHAALVAYDGITQVAYLFWIAGALLAFTLFLTAFGGLFRRPAFLATLSVLILVTAWSSGLHLAKTM